MQRILEPELMDDLQQAVAYDQADFSESHGKRVTLFQERCSQPIAGYVLDIGCGSGDVLERFARVLPDAQFVAVDGAANMLALAKQRVAKFSDITSRIRFIHAFVPSPHIPKLDYQIVMSHSMLHHLHQPKVLWETIKQVVNPKSFIFIGDLRRPRSETQAAQWVDRLAVNEPEILRRDFYNSLCAAFTIDEVREQLTTAGLSSLIVEEVGEVHMLVYGYVR